MTSETNTAAATVAPAVDPIGTGDSRWVIGSTRGDLVTALDFGVNHYGDGPKHSILLRNGLSKYEAEKILLALNSGGIPPRGF